MTIFKSYTFRWWQFAVLKIALLSIGTIVGAYWAEFFWRNIAVVAAIAIVATMYWFVIAWEQIGR